MSTSLTIADRTNLGTPIVRRDHNGVLLRYHPEALRSHHVAQELQPSDRERIALVNAERELLTLEIIFEHLDLSSIGLTRVYDSLTIIESALTKYRLLLKMPRFKNGDVA